MRAATWNVNSMRSRNEFVDAWLARYGPDVALLRETTCTDADLGTGRFAARGYEVAHSGRDHWNRVGLLSRVGMAEVHRRFPGSQRLPMTRPG